MSVELPQSASAGASHWLRRIASRIKAAVVHLFHAARRPIPWPSAQTIMITAASCIALFLVIELLLDATAATAARKSPGLLIALFQEITDFGKSAWFLYPLGALIIAIALAPPDLPRFAQLTLAAIMTRAGFLFLAIGLPSLFTTIVKRIIGRGRPFVGGSLDPNLYHVLIWRPEYASLPSGHATTAFAAAVAVGALWPRARTAMWIYAVLIALSRIIINAHYLSDALAGALVGGSGAILVRNYFAARGLAFGVSAQGAVVPFAGPSLRRIKAVARSLLSE